MMPEIFDISNWNVQQWYNTGGTRTKKYLQSPDGKYFYFKRSYIKPNREYIYEFWSEVVAYQLGLIIGFDVLKYDIAYDNEGMGCIAENMINADNEELVEGIQYIKALNQNFDPSIKEHKTWYTFDLIKEALNHSKIEERFVYNILEMLVFDALIGNGDRHQENWAIISQQFLSTELLSKVPDEEIKKAKWWIRWLVSFIKKNEHVFKEKHKKKELPKSFYHTIKRFAPIYDSGSSLGRELSAERIETLLQSNEELERYLNNGLSEIHWENKKVNHFELLQNILQTNHADDLLKIIRQVKNKFDLQKLRNVVTGIDSNVPNHLMKFKIPNRRKEFIIKLIALRLEKIVTIASERV
jgi:hypothetical protein